MSLHGLRNTHFSRCKQCMQDRPRWAARRHRRTRTYVCTCPRAAHGLDPDRRRAGGGAKGGGRDRAAARRARRARAAATRPRPTVDSTASPRAPRGSARCAGLAPGLRRTKDYNNNELCELTDHKHPGQRALPFKAEVPQNGRKARAVDTRLSVRTPRTEQPRRSPRDGQQQPRCFTVTARQHGSSTHSGTRPCGLTPLDSLEPPGEKLPLRTSRARRRGNLARRVPKHHGITLPIAWRAHVPAERLIETFRAVKH
mmetsp:Transcript_41810/g.96718  ORF Transcript_41810/g.96718 Transcript_41810/m.96718 type:complete len:256 (+) Transcript_41810:161-928(+)